MGVMILQAADGRSHAQRHIFMFRMLTFGLYIYKNAAMYACSRENEMKKSALQSCSCLTRSAREHEARVQPAESSTPITVRSK